MLTPEELLQSDNLKLYEELGKAVRVELLGALPEEEEAGFEDHIIGMSFLRRQLENIRKIYCNNNLSQRLSDEEKQDVNLFVAALIDSFIGYFGVWAGTVILVQIYKFGFERFCKEFQL